MLFYFILFSWQVLAGKNAKDCNDKAYECHENILDSKNIRNRFSINASALRIFAWTVSEVNTF